ncbi:MAG: hypothetical protein EPN25_10725 [Nitrospirae bacterium]|nr:MAG: hypothetical protein EPN25_10725 [Nitrospirota bacterium]
MANVSTTKKDSKSAHDAIELLLNVLPKSETGIHDIAYSVGLICRETSVPVEQATALVAAWSERLRMALPDFRERYPRYKKPSLYRYQVQYAVTSAYKRTQDKPASRKFTSLTKKAAPAASFWDRPETGPESPDKPKDKPADKKVRPGKIIAT